MQHSGQIEKSFQDGTKEVTLPNGTIYTESPTGVKKLNLADGTVIVEDKRKREKQIMFPNGEMEVHTSDYMVRKQPPYISLLKVKISRNIYLICLF